MRLAFVAVLCLVSSHAYAEDVAGEICDFYAKQADILKQVNDLYQQARSQGNPLGSRDLTNRADQLANNVGQQRVAILTRVSKTIGEFTGTINGLSMFQSNFVVSVALKGPCTLGTSLTFVPGFRPGQLGQTSAGDTNQNEAFLRSLAKGDTISFSGKYLLVGQPAPNGGPIFDITNLRKGS